jgi:very-short-patch-repair endonuclease
MREAWKYAEIHKALVHVTHEFEYRIEDCVFDLVLFDDRVLVEFDGKYHRDGKQQTRDILKDIVASEHGYSVERIQTPANEVINPSSVLTVLSSVGVDCQRNKPVGL